MKLYITLIVIFTLVLGFGIFTVNSLAKATEEITGNFEEIYNAIHEKNWKKAQEQIVYSQSLWNEHKTWWTVFINHQEIDNIDESFAKIGEYIKSGDMALSSGELVVLKQSIEHIPIMETVNLKNVL